MTKKNIRLDSSYWDQVADSVKGYYLPQILSLYKSSQYLSLIERWKMLGSGRILITDLYEAAFGDVSMFKELTENKILWAMDISPKVCQLGRERLLSAGISVHFVCCDSRELPFKQDCFELIVSPSTFDHFPEIEKALGECRRVLGNQGRLLLALNSACNPFFRLGVRLAEFFKKKEYETGYFYNTGRIERLLAEANLKTGRQTGLMHIPLGLTTLIQWLEYWPAGRRVNNGIIKAVRLIDKIPDKLKLITGWWVASEGIK